jgi:hypothetical protein
VATTGKALHCGRGELYTGPLGALETNFRRIPGRIGLKKCNSKASREFVDV